jgi:hypothetical protein
LQSINTTYISEKMGRKRKRRNREKSKGRGKKEKKKKKKREKKENEKRPRRKKKEVISPNYLLKALFFVNTTPMKKGRGRGRGRGRERERKRKRKRKRKKRNSVCVLGIAYACCGWRAVIVLAKHVVVIYGTICVL